MEAVFLRKDTSSHSVVPDGQRKYPSIVQIKAAIPSKYFESNVLLSCYYVVKDFAIIFALFLAVRVLEWILPQYLHICVLTPYWYVQGTMFMAVFVLGHDCGHGSFSRYDLLNDTIGTALHSFVLTPFYPWKLSHRNHHKNTGNIDKDEVFYPIRKKHENGSGFVYLFGLGLGWFVYLCRGYHPRKTCHFNPLDNMFVNHVSGCTFSLAFLIGWVYCLYWFACTMGIVGLLKYYVIPELMFASWLLVVTFLHHIEVNTPWYSDDNWNYVKGQTSSVDRNYGWAHDTIHNIGTHQIHHLFSRIPHYHLEAATRHFRSTFPELVRVCDEPIIPSMFRMYKKFSAQFKISDDAGVHVYT